MTEKKVVVAYVPVLHRGYCQLFEQHRGFDTLLVLGPELISTFDHLRKDIRALDPDLVREAVEGWGFFREVLIATPSHLIDLGRQGSVVVMPDEDVSHSISREYLGSCELVFSSIFLRRDRKKTTAKEDVYTDREIPLTGLTEEIFRLVSQEANKSSDWWYHIGAVAVRDGELIAVTHNRHVPSPHTPYVFGDPRIHFKAGIEIELSSALHAEAGLVCAVASRSDLSLAGADLYLTMFPCPPCAKLVAHSGIKRLFFREGYSRLDGADDLRAKGVEIIRVT